MRKLLHGLLVAGVAGATVFFAAGEASAAPCPIFTIFLDVPVVQEGGKVNVTVNKRGSSSTTATVDLTAVSVSASSGSDFEPLDVTVNFRGADSRAFNVAIINDDRREGEERFKLHLSNPQGCEAPEDERDVLGDDRSVRIVASDQSAQGTPSPTTGPTSSPEPTETDSPTSSPDDSPSPSPSESPSPSPSPTLSPVALATLNPAFADEDEDDGISSLGVAGIVIGALAAGAAVTSLFWWRRRY